MILHIFHLSPTTIHIYISDWKRKQKTYSVNVLSQLESSAIILVNKQIKNFQKSCQLEGTIFKSKIKRTKDKCKGLHLDRNYLQEGE